MAAVPDHITTVGFNACLPEFPGNDGCTLLFNSILVKNESDDFGAFRIDRKLSVADIIAEQGCSKDDPSLHLACLTPLYAGRSLSTLFLCDGSHDRKSQFRIRIQGCEPIVHKNNAYTKRFQFSGVGNRIQQISRESADLFGDDQLEFS